MPARTVTIVRRSRKNNIQPTPSSVMNIAPGKAGSVLVGSVAFEMVSGRMTEGLHRVRSNVEAVLLISPATGLFCAVSNIETFAADRTAFVGRARFVRAVGAA